MAAKTLNSCQWLAVPSVVKTESRYEHWAPKSDTIPSLCLSLHLHEMLILPMI